MILNYILYTNYLFNSVDIQTYGSSATTFEEYDEFKWLQNNAHKYGFIIRYPNSCDHFADQINETSIRIRYVGTVHATVIKEKGICLDDGQSRYLRRG